MKQLIIIRHAKSSWDQPLRDIDRPLTSRGIRDAHLVSQALQVYIPKKFIVWCSSAKRTKETAMIFSQNLNFLFENITFKEELYTFDEDKLSKIIKNCENKYDNLILFGHNEAITNFVNKFGTKFVDNVPTSGVVIIQFDIERWDEISKGTLIKTLFPRDFRNE